MENQAASIAEVRLQVSIAAPAKEVWRGLTDDIGQWWPADFYSGGAAGARSFTLEAVPGGRMFETWDGGGGVLWGTVIAIDPHKQLQVLGHLFPTSGGPTTWFGTWTLEESQGVTALSFSDCSVGRATDALMADLDQGWQYLWRSLQAHVEGKPAPQWG